MLIWWSYILVLGAWNEEKKVRWFLICSCPHLLICWGKNRKIFKKKWKDILKKERWKDMERYSTCNDRSWWAAERSILHLNEKLSLELVLERQNYHCKIFIKKNAEFGMWKYLLEKLIKWPNKGWFQEKQPLCLDNRKGKTESPHCFPNLSQKCLFYVFPLYFCKRCLFLRRCST